MGKRAKNKPYREPRWNKSPVVYSRTTGLVVQPKNRHAIKAARSWLKQEK